MKIVIVSNNYPSTYRPNYGAFVYNFVQELSKFHEVHVVTPLRLTDLVKKKALSYGKERAKVYRPYIFPSIAKGGRLKILLNNLFTWHKIKSVERCIISNIGVDIDLFYCHFLTNGLLVNRFAHKKRIPVIIASGESNDAYKGVEKQNKADLESLLVFTSHFVCVSTANVNYLKGRGVPEKKISLIPNAVNYELFKPLGKARSKTRIGIHDKTFVIGFIGHFIERKGPNRIIQALEMLQLTDVILVCVGNNGTLIKSRYVKEIAPVANSELPEIINSFDVFVLPTLSEGHCNVIEEVKAVGVPIISSLGTTVENQIDKKTGILIDPMDINAIANAIAQLKDNPELRDQLVENQLRQRGSNSIEERVKNISSLIEQTLERNKL